MTNLLREQESHEDQPANVQPSWGVAMLPGHWLSFQTEAGFKRCVIAHWRESSLAGLWGRVATRRIEEALALLLWHCLSVRTPCCPVQLFLTFLNFRWTMSFEGQCNIGLVGVASFNENFTKVVQSASVSRNSSFQDITENSCCLNENFGRKTLKHLLVLIECAWYLISFQFEWPW